MPPLPEPPLPDDHPSVDTSDRLKDMPQLPDLEELEKDLPPVPSLDELKEQLPELEETKGTEPFIEMPDLQPEEEEVHEEGDYAYLYLYGSTQICGIEGLADRAASGFAPGSFLKYDIHKLDQ